MTTIESIPVVTSTVPADSGATEAHQVGKKKQSLNDSFEEVTNRRTKKLQSK